MSALIVVTSLAAGRQAPGHCARLAERVAAPLRTAQRAWTCRCDTADIHISSIARVSGAAEPVCTWANDAVTVVLEGYLAEDPAESARAGGDAALVAQRYQARGPAAIEALRGSFILIVANRPAGQLTLWTDRAGTRPCFRASSDGVLVIAPELKCLRDLPGVGRALEPGSLAAMTMNGALMDEHTYYRAVQFVGPARRIEVSRHGIQITRYWQRTFGGAAPGRPPSAPEVAEGICQAARRHLARFRNPILALSGGLDSRLILAACRRNRTHVPAVTWGFDHVDTPGSDFQIAGQLAEQAGIEHRRLRLDVDELPRSAERIVYLTDGLTGHLGNYTSADGVARELAAQHDAVVRGDEMFGDYPIVWARSSALAQVGINVGKRLWLLQFLLRAQARGAVLHGYRCQRQALLDSIPPDVPPADVTDTIFPRTRYPRVIASQSPMLRSHLEVACPLLDNDVVDFLRFCTPQQREDKRYISDCVRAEFPDEFNIPLNSVHSRTSWRTRFPQLGVTQRFLVETLLDPLPSFDEWFDRSAIRAWLGYALAEGQRAPWPADSSPLRRGVRRLGAFLLRPTFKERVVLNLVTLKLWFKLFA